MAAWYRPQLDSSLHAELSELRDFHVDPTIRRKALVILAGAQGLPRQQIADLAGISLATAKRYLLAFRDRGLDSLPRPQTGRPQSQLANHADLIRQSFTEHPARTIAEAQQRIIELTGIKRGLTQVRKFLLSLGLRCRRTRAVPVPPKKKINEHIQDQKTFHDEQLQPRLTEAQAGERDVDFVDACHCVFGTYLSYLWCLTRIFYRAASGRQRLNILGAWNACTQQFVSVINTTVVNTETMIALMRKLKEASTKPITLVLDNAKYQRNKQVQAVANSLEIELLYLPSYSPNLNVIERLWGFLKRESIKGRYHKDFASFREAIEKTIDGFSTTFAERLKSLMTLEFQTFENVSLLAE